MRKTKKLLFALPVLALLVVMPIVLTGCFGGGNNNPTTPTSLQISGDVLSWTGGHSGRTGLGSGYTIRFNDVYIEDIHTLDPFLSVTGSRTSVNLNTISGFGIPTTGVVNVEIRAFRATTLSSWSQTIQWDRG